MPVNGKLKPDDNVSVDLIFAAVQIVIYP